jgi:hypothetical protein
MNAHSMTRSIVSAFVLSLALAGCASAPSAPPNDLLQRVESARTRADHEALAAYYDREAAAARAMASTHRKMAISYQGNLSGGRGGANMPAHCNAIVRNQEALAAEFDAMAAGHRQMGQHAKP